MPHFKCVGCRTRLTRAGSPANQVGDLCPDCGALLEPVGELAEIVGFRSIKARDGADESAASNAHQGLADGIDAFLARREAVLAQARIDAGRWIDEGGSFRAKAVALPRPETTT